MSFLRQGSNSRAQANAVGIRFRLFAVLALLAWTGVHYHDAWLDLAGVKHHHPHHGCDHHHGHSHEEETGHEHEDSTPLANTHEDPIAHGPSSVGVKGPKLCGIDLISIQSLEDHFAFARIASETDHPPPKEASRSDPQGLLLLNSCVRSNAPPFSC